MTPPLVSLLLVEDNAGDARLIRALLDEAGPGRFVVHHEETLRGALAHLARAAFDAVLLDLDLPDERGVETVARVTATAPQLPIVVLTGTTDEQLAARAMEHGAQDYLVKGRVDGAGLVRALRHALARKRAVETTRRLAEERASRAAAEQTARQLRAVSELARTLADAPELKVAHQAAAELIAAAFPEAACAIDVDTPQGRRRWIEAGGQGARSTLQQTPPERMVDAPPAGLLVEDTGAGADRAESLCAVPLSAHGRRIGAVVVAARVRLTTGDLQFLRELSRVLSLSLESARISTGGMFAV